MLLFDGQIEQIAFARNAFAVEDVELGLAERRRHFVLHDFHRVREPVTTSPSLMAAMRRMSMRTEE